MFHKERTMETTLVKKKRMSALRVSFIFFCCTTPVLSWLVFYIYGNFFSFTLAFTDSEHHFTLEHFQHFWEQFANADGEIFLALKNTFITFLVMFALLPFQVLVSYFLYKRIPGHSIYRVLFFLPMIIFSVAKSLIVTRMLSVTGFVAEWIQEIFKLPEVPELLADSRYANITVLAHLVWLNIPGDLIIWGGTFARIPPEIIESGRVDGVNWWQEFTRIIIPMIWPTVALRLVLSVCGIFSASGAVFLLTRGEFGTETLSSWMYKQVLKGAGMGADSWVFNYMSAVGMSITAVAITLSLTVRRFVDKIFSEVEY